MIYIEGPGRGTCRLVRVCIKGVATYFYTIYVQSTHKRATAPSYVALVYLACAY